MKTITINKNDSGQRLDKFLTKSFFNMPQSIMYKAIRTKNIKLNRKRCEISTRLCEGDVLDIYLNDEFLETQTNEISFLNASDNLKIVYEDENILLLDKPVGLIVHSDENNTSDTLIDRVLKYLYNKKEYLPDDELSFTPSLVNRIDRNTSGIVIAAKNAQSLRVLNQKMKDRELEKLYLTVVCGTLKNKEGLLTGYLVKNEEQNRVYIHDKAVPNGKSIRTKYKVLKEKNDYSLIEVDLLTGRTHQIRAHFASIGHPIVGDGKYSTNLLNKKTGFKNQALCSYKLTFKFTTDSENLEYLNNKTFSIDNVWFLEKFDKGI